MYYYVGPFIIQSRTNQRSEMVNSEKKKKMVEIIEWSTWKILDGCFMSIIRNSNRLVMCLLDAKCSLWDSVITSQTHTRHTHMHRGINHYIPPTSPEALEARKRGMEEWIEWTRDEGIGGLRAIKMGYGLVCMSPANPPSDKRETSDSQLQTPTHSILFHSFHRPPPLLSYAAFHHYLIPCLCSGLSYI